MPDIRGLTIADAAHQPALQGFLSQQNSMPSIR
jgi:hypothetical protein